MDMEILINKIKQVLNPQKGISSTDCYKLMHSYINIFRPIFPHLHNFRPTFTLFIKLSALCVYFQGPQYGTSHTFLTDRTTDRLTDCTTDRPMKGDVEAPIPEHKNWVEQKSSKYLNLSVHVSQNFIFVELFSWVSSWCNMSILYPYVH